MKQIVNMLCIVLLLFTGTGKAQDVINVSTSAYDPSIDPYHLASSNAQKGFLEGTRMTIGTIFKSHHFNDDDFNQAHNGIYVSLENWSMGTFRNSGNTQSNFVAYNPNLYRWSSLEVNLVAGMADGYEDWKYAQNGYLPILGVSAQWQYLKTMLTPNVVAFGIEIPLN